MAGCLSGPFGIKQYSVDGAVELNEIWKKFSFGIYSWIRDPSSLQTFFFFANEDVLYYKY